MRARLFPSILLVFFLFLAGCSGSDGTSSVDGSLTVTPGSVTATGETGSSLPINRYLNWSSSNPNAALIIVGYPVGMTPPSWLSQSFSGPNQIQLTFSANYLSPGTYTTTVRVVTARADNSVVDIKDISVTFNVDPATIATPSILNFTAVEGEPGAVATQIVNLTRGGNPVTPTGVYSPGNWMQGTIVGDDVEISPTSNAATLAPGSTYLNTMTVYYAGGSVSVATPLTVTNALGVTPAPVSFNIDLASVPADKTTTVSVTGNRTTPINWSAAAGSTWINVSPASGDTSTADNLTVSLNQTELDLLVNGTYSGTVTISSSDPNTSSITLTVNLTKNMPSVDFVAPYEAISGTQNTVVIRGAGFQDITSPAVKFGTSDAVSFSVISDTEISATHGTLVAGTYSVTVNGINSTNTPTTANLVVKDAPSYAYAVLPSSGQKMRMFYSLEQGAVYLFFENSRTKVQRYQFNVSNWVNQEVINGGIVWFDVARSPNGQAFYGVQGPYIMEISPTTLSRVQDIFVSSAWDFQNIDFANTGDAIMYSTNVFARLAKYNILNGNSGLANNGGVRSLYKNMASSRNGSRVYLASTDTVPGSLFYFDASQDTVLEDPLSIDGSRLAADRTGSVLIMNNKVYDSSFVLLGDLPASTLVATVTDDGAIAYTYEISGVDNNIRKFDLTTPDGNGGFTEIGSAITMANSPGTSPLMTISPDGGTLFIAGNSNLIVQPAP